jgi:hypothetical protein
MRISIFSSFFKFKNRTWNQSAAEEIAQNTNMTSRPRSVVVVGLIPFP